MKPDYLQTTEEVLSTQGSSSRGLTGEEAAARLSKHGPNRLQEAKKITNFQRFVQQLKDPMLLILLAAAAVSAVTSILSHESLTEVFIILVVVLLNAVLGVVQESKAEAAIEALQTMTAATSKVLRDGKITVLHSADLVPGDVVILEAGDAVPADGRLLESASLKIEEAALTGESVPVNKTAEPIAAEGDVPLGDRKNMCYMGSTVVYGRGSAVITATGMDTEMGKIAGVLARTEQEETPLQRKLNQLGKTLSYLVLAICVFIFVFDLLVEGDYSLEAILKTFMVAVSLAVAAIPEGLATVVTVVLSIGVTNMSKRGAVIRRLTAVETLGCTQVICSDKTGTLTQNKMTVVDHTGPQRLLATAMALCSDAAWTEEGAQGEPTEAALVNFAAKAGLKKTLLEEQQPRVAEAPFDSSRKMMSTVHQIDGGFIQYTKGAPDEVLRLCTSYIDSGEKHPMTEEKRRAILLENKAMADRALRVLAAAQRSWGDTLPEDISPETLEQDLCFIGLAGMIDPVRPEVKDAIHQCRKAGIRPVMITGDHKDTAVAIEYKPQVVQLIAQRALAGLGGVKQPLARHAGAFELVHGAEQHRLKLGLAPRRAVNAQPRIQPVGSQRHAQKSAALVEVFVCRTAALGAYLARKSRERQHLGVQRQAVAAHGAQLALGLVAVLLGNEQDVPLAAVRAAADLVHDRRAFARTCRAVEYSEHSSTALKISNALLYQTILPLSIFSGALRHLRIHISLVARFGTMVETVCAARNASEVLNFPPQPIGSPVKGSRQLC